jgi:hypothetical protein
MNKYPWDKHKEIDWDKDWQSITKQFSDKYYESVDDLIDWYFKAKMYKMGFIVFGIISALLLYMLITVAK